MASAIASIPTRTVVRKLACTVVGVFLFAAGLTFLWLGMRAVMDVGGYCASGGPYEIRQECPDGTGLIFLGIFAGLVGTGLTVAGTFAGGPQLWTLAWPALFCSLGWNFLEYGIDPPPPDQGPVWGWLICAIAFLAMGGIPLLGILLGWRSVLWGRDDGPAATPRATVRNLRSSARSARPTRTLRTPATPFGTTTVPSAPRDVPPPTPPTLPDGAESPPPGTPTVVVFDTRDPESVTAHDEADAGALVRDLERLSALHREGALSDQEFARAKAARLAEEPS